MLRYGQEQEGGNKIGWRITILWGWNSYKLRDVNIPGTHLVCYQAVPDMKYDQQFFF